MPEINLLAVAVATVSAFLLGGVYYAIAGSRLAELRGTDSPPPRASRWMVPIEILRCLVLAVAVAWLATQARTESWVGGVGLGLVLWIGFPFVLWIGAVVHERTPWRLAAIHAGDWLLKLLVVAVVVSA
jgi:hypothetical protein